MDAMLTPRDIWQVFRRMLRPCARLGSALLPTAIVCAALAAVGIGATAMIPQDRLIAMKAQANTQLVSAYIQWRRANTEKAELAFVGDSTCENGIETEWLTQRLSRRVINLCTMAYAGPGGYGETLEAFLTQASPDARVVVALHARFFARDEAWESAWGSPRAMAHKLESEFGWRWTANAMWDRERLFYVNTLFERVVDTPTEHHSVSETIGGLASYRWMMTARGFYHLTTLIDCLYCLPDEYQRLIGTDLSEPSAATPAPEPNAQFNQSVARLRQTLARVGPARVYVLFMPFSDAELSSDAATQLRITALAVTRAMGLPEDHLLQAPLRLPARMFGDGFHLTRPGQVWFSDRIVPVLRGILPPPQVQ